MRIENFSRKKRRIKNLILYGITVTADILLVVCILSVRYSTSPLWLVAAVLSTLWIVLFGLVNCGG